MAVIRRVFVEKKAGPRHRSPGPAAGSARQPGHQRPGRPAPAQPLRCFRAQRPGNGRGRGMPFFPNRRSMRIHEDRCPLAAGETAFAIEYLPGQYDQRADSAVQCLQLLSPGASPKWPPPCGPGPRPGSSSCRAAIAAGGDRQDQALLHQSRRLPRSRSWRKPASLVLRAARPAAVPVLKNSFRCRHGNWPRWDMSWVWPWTLPTCAILPGLFPRPGTARPDPDRDPPARHLLVGPLPAHHFSDRHHPGGHRPGRWNEPAAPGL